MRGSDQGSRPRSGLRVGETAPEFTLPDGATGAPVALAAVSGGRDTLLVFFRGTWCPFCREQMRVLTASQNRLARAEVSVVGVVCQSAGSVRRFLEARSLPFPLLVDESRSVAKAYGVHYRLSWEGFNLAAPSLFVLDRTGRITFCHVGAHMRDLPLLPILERFVGLFGGNNGAAASAPIPPTPAP
jgi:peroxiredoxin Q/BCP